MKFLSNSYHMGIDKGNSRAEAPYHKPLRGRVYAKNVGALNKEGAVNYSEL